MSVSIYTTFTTQAELAEAILAEENGTSLDMNMSSANFRALGQAIGLPAGFGLEDPGTMPAVQVAELAQAYLAKGLPDEGVAVTDSALSPFWRSDAGQALAGQLGLDLPQPGCRVIDFGRREGYLPERARQLLELAQSVIAKKGPEAHLTFA